MEIDINNIGAYREGNHLKAKLAKGALPNSIWKTYSSFANPGDIRIGLNVALSGVVCQ